jgi:hypothetical protein
VFSGFRQKLQVIENKTTFIATDCIMQPLTNNGLALQMIDVAAVNVSPDYVFF